MCAAAPDLVCTLIARRTLLHQQGLLDRRKRASPRAVFDLIERLGFVQIDSINVIERAHHLTLSGRLDGYRPAMLSKLLEESRLLFEHWTHDASAIPTNKFPHWRHRFERYRKRLGAHAWWMQRLGEEPERLLEAVRRRIADEGPLLSKDFDGERIGPSTWWGWKREKAALEHLWRTGELAIAKRIHFQKVYDLTERIYPRHARLPPSDETAHVEWAFTSALERLGFASPAELAAFWAAVDLSSARRWCEEKAKLGEIVPVLVEPIDGTKPKLAYAATGWKKRAARLPDTEEEVRLLSPFDPVLRDRQRTERLFGFDYRFEAFVPKPKRRYGYYVMPLLQGDRLIGRVDPALDRAKGLLEIRRVWWEPGVRATKRRVALLEAEVARLSGLIGVERWRISP